MARFSHPSHFYLIFIPIILLIVFISLHSIANFISIAPTPAQSPPTITLIAAGDIACHPNYHTDSKQECQQKSVSDLFVNLDPKSTLILALGDITYPYQRNLDYKSFHNSWGRFKGKILPVPGNHDYEDGKLQQYLAYFEGLTNPDGYYTYNLGNWQLFALNSNCEFGLCDKLEQRIWLENQLASSTSICKLAFMHHPLFSSDTRGKLSQLIPLWDILTKYQVSLVLTGHLHSFERFASQTSTGEFSDLAPREFIIGTGGRNLYEFGIPAANSQFRYNQSFGILKLTLHPNSYSWQFINLDHQIIDSGQSICVTQ